MAILFSPFIGDTKDKFMGKFLCFDYAISFSSVPMLFPYCFFSSTHGRDHINLQKSTTWNNGFVKPIKSPCFFNSKILKKHMASNDRNPKSISSSQSPPMKNMILITATKDKAWSLTQGYVPKYFFGKYTYFLVKS